MRPRPLLLTVGMFVLMASAAIAVLGDPTAAGELRPPVLAESPHGDVPGDEPPVAAAGGAVQPSQVAVAEPVFRPRERPDTAEWTSGVIAGDIPLSSAVLAQIQSIAVVVDELKNVRAGGETPWRKVVPVELGVGTPTFVVRDVPFSDYGYTVRVHSPGLNGGQATVAITKEQPYVDDVKLAITPGSPFSLRLRDQDFAPVQFVVVRLLPTGEPLGRPRLDGLTDNFGSVVFENALAGDYQVFVGPPGQPLMTPPVITVQPGSYLRQGTIVQPQGLALTVPRGVPVEVAVVDRSGYPVQGARVRLRTTDRPHPLEHVELTDVRGQVRCPAVLEGQWEIDVQLADHQTIQQQLLIKKGEPPPPQNFTLIRLR